MSQQKFISKNNMRNIILATAIAICTISCGEKKNEKKESFTITNQKKEISTDNNTLKVPVDMANKGIGPISTMTLSEQIDPEMVAAGKAIYQAKCTTCHMAERRMIGPALKGVFNRRSPEWVMNMILNPTEMIKKDPIAKALLKEYNNAVMLNQNLTETDARNVTEYLRTL